MLLCTSTGAGLWRPEKGLPNERRRKAGQSEPAHREGHAVSAGPVKTFRKAGDVKNGTAGLRTKGNLREKRRDPCTRRTRRQKRRLTLCETAKTRKKVADVSWSGLQAGGATTSSSKLKSLTRKPAVVRHWPALLRGRKLRLPWRIASGSRQPARRLMPARERERGELPSPDLSLPDRKVGRGLFVFAGSLPLRNVEAICGR